MPSGQSSKPPRNWRPSQPPYPPGACSSGKPGSTPAAQRGIVETGEASARRATGPFQPERGASDAAAETEQTQAARKVTSGPLAGRATQAQMNNQANAIDYSGVHASSTACVQTLAGTQQGSGTKKKKHGARPDE